MQWSGLKFVGVASKAALKKWTGGDAKAYIIQNLLEIPGVPAKLAQFFLSREESESSLDKVEPLEISEVKSILETEAPELVGQVDLIEEKGLRASIGQVHRVGLLDGRTVAVKLQLPGIDQGITQQLDTVLNLSSWGPAKKYGFDIETYRDWMQRQILREVDYHNEAQTQTEFGEFIATSLSEVGIIIPKVYHDLSGPRVLVQDYEESVGLSQLKKLETRQRREVGEALAKFFFNTLFGFHHLHVDMQVDNWGYQSRTKKLVIYDFGSTLSVTRDQVKVLYQLIEGSCGRKEIQPFEAFVELGFDRDKLFHIYEQLPALCQKIFEPLVEERPWSAKDWEIGEYFKNVLGDDAWWFRTAGPPWFLYLMRAVHQLMTALRELDIRVNLYEIYQQVVKEFHTEKDISLTSQKSFIESKGVAPIFASDCAKWLNVRVLEQNTEKVALQMPVRAVDEIENMIDPEVVRQIREQGFNLNEIKQKIQKSGYLPQEVFDLSMKDKSYKVWLSR